MLANKMSVAQKSRQSNEHRENGKYSKVNPCQGCGKSAGVNYWSHVLTDSPGWADKAICLCKKCADATQDLTSVKDFLAFAKVNGGSNVG